MAVKFQEGWQKKAGHESIRDSGDAASKAAEQAEKAKLNFAQAAQKGGMAKTVSTPKAPVAPGKDVPQTQQRIRPETQDQAARSKAADTAAREHVQARDKAKGLQALQTKASSPERPETATRTAVTAKVDPQQLQVKTQDGKQPEQQALADQSAKAPLTAAKKPAEAKPEASKAKAKAKHKGKAKDAQKAAAKAKPDAQDALKAARTGQFAEGAAVASTQIIKGGSDDIEIDDVEFEDEGIEEKDRDSSTFAKGAGRKRSTENQLASVLSGSAGGTSGEEAQAEADGPAQVDVSAAKRDAELPETDPEFKVYSEFDTSAPGVEHIKSKAQVFEKLVVQRIKQIAKLDREIGDRIKDIFGTPLSERIEGELKDDLNTADFLTSVYGGING